MISMYTLKPVEKYPVQIAKFADPKTVFQAVLSRLREERSQEMRDRLCNVVLDIYRTRPAEARTWAQEWRQARGIGR